MIEFAEALKIAKKYYFERGEQEITKAYDAGDMWIIYGGKKGLRKIGSAGLTIDKKTGEQGGIVLPSARGFEILRNATLMDID